MMTSYCCYVFLRWVSVLRRDVRLLFLCILTIELCGGRRGAFCAFLQGIDTNNIDPLRGPRKSLRQVDQQTHAQTQGWPPLPWQQPPQWVPPYAPYINDLRGLINAQRRDGVQWLTVFALTRLRENTYEGQIFLNTLTTYILLGGGESFVVMVANDEALETCQRLKLPCYNATVHVNRKFLSSYTFGTWAKVLMTRLVLRALPADMNLHLSDHDVLYLKKILPTVDRFAAGREFDVLGQYEDHPSKGINTGVIFARNNPRVHAMYDEWVRHINPTIHDQDTFFKLVGEMTVLHGRGNGGGGSGAESSVAVVLRHNPPWTNNHWCRWCGGQAGEYEDCWAGDDSRNCEVPYRMYIHVICVADKMRFIRSLGLWFLDYQDPLKTNYSAIAAAGLPCAPPNDVADFRPWN